jgi:(1->4)-alpha-D-glucan 1-alpha-D-glucosylmutase
MTQFATARADSQRKPSLAAAWKRTNLVRKPAKIGRPALDRNDEYLLCQTLIGAWPFEPLTREEFAESRERIATYMVKATKEAKIHTNWVNPHEEYDAAVRSFVFGTLADDANPFLDD